MLELARAFAKGEAHPRRTLLFAAWNAEELGAIGSCTYADVAPLCPLASTAAAFSIDMVGQGTRRAWSCTGRGGTRSPPSAA